MRVVFFAALLSVVQAAPPVPRQTSDSANQTADKGKKKADQHQGPIAQTPPPKPLPEKTVSEKAPPDNPASLNTQQPIRIAELPPVSVTKDWIDITGWIFSGILVGVGIVGICAAYKTLRVIARQTVAIEQQTKLQTLQWVALKNWRGEILQPYMLGIKVDIVNETNFPLTLEGTDFRVGTVTSAGTENVTIVPQAAHSIGFIHRMMKDEYMAYLANGTAFGIRGAIRFSGISGKKVQPFGGLIAASFGNGISYESRSEYEQSAKEHYGDKEPPN